MTNIRDHLQPGDHDHLLTKIRQLIDLNMANPRDDVQRWAVKSLNTFFEKESTRVNILQYRLTEETQEEVSRALVQAVDENPWVKGVEFLLTIRGMSLTGLCDGLSKVRKDVQIFGGGAFSGDINANEACVFSKEGGYQEKGIVFVLMGGEDLHITSSYVCGWKPLGSFLRITSAERSILKELNGQPAYNTFSLDQRLMIRHTHHYTAPPTKKEKQDPPASPSTHFM